MYKLHFAPDNASLIVRLTLEDMGQPYQTSLVDRGRVQQDSPTYRALNPTGLIPALETPQGVLFETAAILLWLTETHGQLAPQPGSPERGAFLKWLFFVSNSLHADIRLHFYPDRYAGSIEGLPAFRNATEQRLLRHLGLIDRMIVTDAPGWLAPGEPSALTWYLCSLLRWLGLYPTDRRGWFDLTAFPALLALARAAEVTPAAQRAAAAEGLGPTIFSAPSYARPPEGRVT